MSMKRSKQKTGGGSRSSDEISPFFAKPAEREKTWKEDVETQPEEAFAPYSLKSRFANHALLNHPKFGKGIVVAVEGGVVSVLFADGKKKLGHAPA